MIDQNLLQKTANLSDIQNNYVTGGPGPSYVNNVLDKYMTPAPSGNKGVPSQANTPLSETPSGPRFPYYYPSMGVAGNEELYAQGQSWYSKAANATAKGIGLAATTFAQGTIGMIIGTANAIADGKMSSFYDNGFSRSLDDFNKSAENVLPNYYTQQESDADVWSPKNLFTANFLFDKVIKNMGFAVGAIGAAYATAGTLTSLGLFTKIASAGGLAEAAAMTEEAIAGVQTGQRAAAIENGMKSVAQKFLNQYNVLNKAQRAITAGLGTVGEASFEAIQSSKEFRDKLLTEYVQRTGTEARGQDLEQINDMAERAGNATFGLNTALLSVTNYIQWPKILGSSYAAERRLFADGAQEINDLAVREGKYITAYEAKNLAGKALYKAKNVASIFFSPTEAFEEGAQTAIQHGVSNYYDKAYNDGKGGTPDILTDLYGEGARYALTSKEGIESMIIGGLSGGIMEARHQIKTRGITGTGGSIGVNTAAAIDAFNQNTFTGSLKEKMDSANRGQVLQDQRAESIRRGDFQEARDLEYDYGHNYLAPRIKYGRFDMVLDDIDTQRQLSASDEGMAQLRGDGIIDSNTTAEQYRSRLANIERHARSMNLMYQSLNVRYASLRDKEGRNVYPPEVIDKMVYAASKVADYDERMRTLSAEVMARGVDISAIVGNISENGSIRAEDAQGLMAQIDNMDVISETKDALREQVRDLAEIGLRRKAFIREYDRIKKNPSTYRDQELIPSDTDSVPVPQLDQEGNYKRKSLALGQTYSTTDPFLREGDKIVVRPTATLHERNALGEVRATVPTGETKFIQPKDLRGYNFAERSPYNADITDRTFQSSLDSVLERRGVEKPEGTLQEQLNTLSELGDPELMDSIEAAFQRDLEAINKAQGEIDALEKDKEKQKELQDVFNQMSAEAGTVATGDPAADQELIALSIATEGNKKTADILFTSTTSPDTSGGTTENDDFHRRANKFLNNLPAMASPEQLKAIFVTRANQDALGLSGFIPETGDQSVDEAVIRVVFVRNAGDNTSFIDDKGVVISKVGKPVSNRQAILDSIDTENYVYLTHQTDRVGAARIENSGFDIRQGLTGTTLLANRDTIAAQVDDIESGTGHKGSDTIVIYRFPKEQFKDIRQPDDISDILIEDGSTSITDDYIADVYVRAAHDFNRMVYSTMPSTSINWKNGQPRYITIGPKAITEAQATALASSWREVRKNILSQTGYSLQDFTVSRGIPNVVSKTDRNPVTTSLVSPRDLDSPLIHIPTQSTEPGSKTAYITVGDKVYAYPIGRPVLVNGSTIAYLNNRTLTDQERSTIKKSIVLLSTDVSNRAIRDYLKGTLYWGRPKGTPSSNQIWYDNGKLYMGSEQNFVPFIPSVIETSPELDKFLRGAFTNTNNFLLKQNNPYNEIISIADDGTINQVEWRSYQHYLLSPTYITTEFDGSGLDGLSRENIPLTTNIAEQDANDPYSSPFEQKYATITGLDVGAAQIVSKPSVEKSSPSPAPVVGQQDTTDQLFSPLTQAGKYILDGVSFNPIERKGSFPLEVSVIHTVDGPEITGVKWNIPDEAPDQVREALLLVARSDIAEAILETMSNKASTVVPTPETRPVVTVAPPSTPEDPKEEEAPAPAGSEAEMVQKLKKLPFEARVKALKALGFLSDIYRYGNRPVFVFSIDGKKIPFYRSSQGTSGKQQGQWFPMFGFGKSKPTDTELGWLIKGTVADMNKFMGSNSIARVSFMANSLLNWEHELDLKPNQVTNPFYTPTLTGDEAAFNTAVYGKADLGVVNSVNGAQYAMEQASLLDQKESSPQPVPKTSSKLSAEDKNKIDRLKADIDKLKSINVDPSSDENVKEYRDILDNHFSNPDVIQAIRSRRMPANNLDIRKVVEDALMVLVGGKSGPESISISREIGEKIPSSISGNDEFGELWWYNEPLLRAVGDANAVKKHASHTRNNLSSEKQIKEKLEEIERIELAAQNVPQQNPSATPPATNVPATDYIKNLRPPSADSSFRKASFAPYKVEDITAFTAYMQENLPQIPVHNLQNIIEMTGNGYAFGMFRDNAVYLYEKAEIGTGYHEAFEAVYNAFLTNKEQTALQKEFNRRPGTFTDRETGQIMPYRDATAHQAKEQMAEEFRDFKLNGTLFTPKETSFFRKLIAMIREFISGNTINKVFKKLNTGYYADKPVIQRRVDAQFRPAGFSAAFFREVMEGMTVRMFQELFKDNKNIVAFDEQNPKSVEVYKKIYDNFENLYDNDLQYQLNEALDNDNASAEIREAAWGEFWKMHTEVWGSIKNNWADFVKEHKDFLKPFSVVFTQDENADEVISKENNINNDDKTREYERDILTIDAKKSASTAVKLLFATLTDVERMSNPINQDETFNNPREKIGAAKLPKVVKYASVFNKFLHEVANTNGLNNILIKLKNLAVRDQRYIRLYNRLRASNNYQNLSIDDWKLLMKVYSTASKQKPDYLVQITDDAGNTYIQNSNDNTQTRILVRSWLNNMKGAARNGSLVYVDDGIYKINPDHVRTYQIGKSAEDRFRFVSDIGFTFTQEMYNTLTPYDRKQFNDAVISLHAQLLKSGEIGAITSQALGISGAMSKLAEVAVKATGDDSNSQHFNIDGEPVQNFILNNYISTIINDINAFPTRESMFEALPHLNDIFSLDSRLLRLDGVLFDKEGNRKENPLKVVIVEGSTKSVNNNTKGTATSNLSIADRRMQEFNQNLNGVYYVLMPADSKTEWSMRLGHYINFSDYNNRGSLTNKVNSIFRNYLKTEIMVARDYANRKQLNNLKDNGNQLRFFKDILSPGMVSSVQLVIDDISIDVDTWVKDNDINIAYDVNDWISKRVDDQIANFKEYRILRSQPVTKDEEARYLWTGLDSEFASTAEVKTVITESQVRDVVNFRTLNYVINNIEMHKVFFGDPMLYKDATKRIKSFLSGREVTYNTDPEFNLFANDELNKAGNIDLMPGDPGYYRFKDYMNTVTVSDIELVGSIAMNTNLTADQIDPQSKDKIYGRTNEADAQSWATLGAYREMLLKAGGRWTDEQEAQFEYDSAYERDARSRRNDKYKWSYPKDERGAALKAHDEALIATPSPEADLYVIKPIGTGVKYNSTFSDMFLDKTSTLPMSYRLAEGRQMEEIYLQMVTQDKQYLIAISGRKVGAEGTHSMYNPDGSINSTPFNNNVQVPFKYWGIQVETGGHKDKQTRGSQLTKLSVIDLLNAGVPIDLDIPLDSWLGMREEERLASSNVYSLVQKNKQLLESMTNRGYSDVLSKLGIVETDEGFNIPNYQKVVDYIRREIDRRELPDNVRDAVSVNPVTGDFNIPLEALNNYKILKNIIYSIVDKNILSPKISGGPKVQVSSTLFEKNKRQAVYKEGGKWETVTDYEALTPEQKKTVRLTSSELKFYTSEAPWIEILVPHWFKDKLVKEYKKRGKPLPTDEQLLAHLKDSPLLKAIGFRIPTQALSSVENIRIKGFLPQSYGGAVVVPSEITSKAGSDFDIDKLNIYLRNFRIVKGMPEHIDLESGIDPTSEKGQRKLYDKFFGSAQDLIRMMDEAADDAFYREEEDDQAINSLVHSIFGEYTNDISSMIDATDKQLETYKRALEKYIPFEKFQEMIDGKTLYDIYGMFEPKALENEYYENLNQLLSLPQNFKRLIQPNSAKELEDLRDELLEAQGLQKSDVKGNYSVLLDPMFMSKVRHNFISGKGGVGIAAVQQTNNPLSQAAILVVNHRNLRDKLSPLERSMVPNVNVLLPHNTVTIAGESFVTLSKIKNTLGDYISDKISSYINGYVDVAKDAFIIELGADLNVASTYMFLEKIGVPTDTVIFFMNQPIIRELLKTMQINALKNPNTWTVQKKITSEVRGMFPTKGPRSGPLDFKNFKRNIEKYRDQREGTYKFNEEDNAEQQQILDEFYKYYVMASHLFKVTQGSNYDTANFSEPALTYLKQRKTENARQKSIISSVDSILNTSFIGNTADKVIRVKGAIGTIFKLDNPAVAPILESVIDPYVDPDKFISEKDYLGISNKIQSSFIDWITQTKGEGKLGSRLKALLIDKETAVANELFALKKNLPRDSDILNNPVLQQLQATFDNSYSSEVKIVTLIEKANDAPTANMYTEAFRELRDNPHTTDLYYGVIYAGILQSGIRKSPISFTDLIPVEDYSPILSQVMQNLPATPDLGKFADMNVFQRNNWSDDTIVPEAQLKKKYDNPQDPFDYTQEAYSVIPAMSTVKGANSYSFIKLHSLKDQRLTGYPVVKVGITREDPDTDEEYTKSKMEIMRKRGDYSFKTWMLYTPIMTTMTDGSRIPYQIADPDTPGASYIYYKQINAWGTPGKVQEYYSTPEKSILPSNYKVNELSDTDILNAISKPKDTKAALQEQAAEIRFKDDYLNFEEISDNGSTEQQSLIGPAPVSTPTDEETIRQQAAEAPFDISEDDIQKILKDKDNCKGK